MHTLSTRLSALYLLTLTLLAVPTSLLHSQELVVNGSGEYTEFGKATVLVKLELGAPATTALDAITLDTPKRLSFRLLEDRSVRSWSRIWIQSLSINNPPDAISNQTTDLIAMTRAIKGGLLRGDLIEIERVDSTESYMMINGVELVQFDTPEFFEFLLSAFIGPVPPSGRLKGDLLSGSDIELSIAFNSVVAESARLEAVASWLPEEESEAAVEEAPSQEPEEPSSATVQIAANESSEEEETLVEEVTSTPVATADTSTSNDGDLTREVEQTESEPEEEITQVATAAEESNLVGTNEDEAPFEITAESLLAVQQYQRSVIASIYSGLKYPRSAKRREREGSLRASVAINRNGSLDYAVISEKADFNPFNTAAMKAITNATPFPPVPDAIQGTPLVLSVPIRFRLQ